MSSEVEPMCGRPPGAEREPPDPGSPARRHRQAEQEAVPQEDEGQPTQFSQDSIVPETQQSQAAPEEVGERNKRPTEEAGEEAKTDSPQRSHPEEQTAEQQSAAPPAATRADSSEGRPAVQPQEMFAAVVAAMKAAPTASPREEWLTTIAALYAISHRLVSIDKELVPTGKQRYPKLKGDEKALLYSLFRERCVLSEEKYVDWDRCMTTATQDLYNSRVSFKHLMQSLISKAKWARLPPLNQWAAKVGTGTSAAVSTRASAATGDRYMTYMFNPALYSRDEITTLRAICAKPQAASQGCRLREGTAEEWRIITGIAEGTIVCRRMPDFLRSVLDSKERVRLHSTVKQQVEGELVLHLRSWVNIKETRQQTRAIKDDILMAAAALGARVNLTELQTMLNMTKTISFNFVQRNIHFFFFDRVTAQKYQNTLVSFMGVVYPLSNVHHQATGSVWSRQLGRDGVRLAVQREYEIHIQNITRFTDIGRLMAYLQRHLVVDFELEDLDECTPDSRTSTVWKLTMKSAECPEYLRGIVRIVWFGRTLILKHPYARQRLQCLRCGNLGHPLARCSYAEEQLRGEGSRVAEDKEIAGLEDLAKPFASMAEVKESAARRLKLQMAAENKSQAAVQPAPAPAQQSGQGGEHHSDQKSPEGVDGSFEHPEVAPKPKQKWIATPLSRGRTLYAHPNTLKQRGLQLSSRYAELVDADGNDDDEESKTEDKPPAQPVIEISSDDGLNMPVKPTITTEAKEALHLVKAKPPKLPETPQLVALKQRERDVVAAAAATFADKRGPGLPVSAAPVDEIKSFPEIEELLGIRSVVTPSTGNCMAMAIEQAVADHNLAAFDDKLEEMTAAIKRGIRWSGQLNYREQFDHFTRMTTLINVERGWDGMTAQDSNKQFKWYLEEYAATPSDRNAIVAGHNWGSSELMAAAANLLQTKIYVLAHNTDKKGLWYCSVYRPSTVTRGRKRYDTGQQVPLHLERCIEEIRAVKVKGNTPPLVLRFWGEHYSAFVHTNPPEVRRVHLPEEETKRAVSAEDLPLDMQAEDGRVAPAETPKGSQSTWEPTTWDGNIAELKNRLMGMSIPHDLKCEIHLILERAEPTRHAELLAFLVNTASQLSLGEREQLLRMNLEADNEEDVRIMMQRYQISKVVLGQWQQTIRREQHKEAERRSNEEEEASPDSDPSYCPSSASSLQTLQEDAASTTRQLRSQGVQQKRQHTITPIEGEAIRRYMRSKTAHQPDSTEVEPMQDDWQASVPTEQKLTRAEWKQLWINQRSVWPATARVPFPQPSGTADEWTETARTEPTNLLLAVQRFPFPDEVLAQLNDQVLEAWTAAWRRDCLHGSLVTYSSRVTDKQTLKWLNKWKEKFIRPPPHNLSPLIDSSEDWNKLRGRQYGEDEVLELCDTGNKCVLAQHLLCALIYDKEIRALTNQEEMSENGALTRLNRHLLALTTVEGYSAAYLTTSNSVDWFAIARYFSTVLEHGPPERDSNY